jgi:hypothetical protein
MDAESCSGASSISARNRPSSCLPSSTSARSSSCRISSGFVDVFSPTALPSDVDCAPELRNPIRFGAWCPARSGGGHPKAQGPDAGDGAAQVRVERMRKGARHRRPREPPAAGRRDHEPGLGRLRTHRRHDEGSVRKYVRSLRAPSARRWEWLADVCAILRLCPAARRLHCGRRPTGNAHQPHQAPPHEHAAVQQRLHQAPHRYRAPP